MNQATISTPRILVVDDEPNIVTAIRFLMEQEGFETRTASDGKEAMEALNGYQPDLLILDVMMPNKTGFELATELRGEPRFADVQILFLTAKGSDKDKRTGYGSGGDKYLTKPFDNQHLISTVKSMLDLDTHPL